jgi:hypothetical protein
MSDMNARVGTDVRMGAEAARLLLNAGIGAADAIQDPLTERFAESFVQALSAGMSSGRRGWVGDVMDGTGRLARNLNVEPEHGLVEVIQNADDLGASCVRFVFSSGPPRRILVVHDGARVRAPHVLAMTLALVSTKSADDMSTGKFGIGLKTLNRLADRFDVHSPPYDFAVADQHLSSVGKHEPLPNVWDPLTHQTLLALLLRRDYPDEGLMSWFESVSADSLLFLSSVRRLELRDADGALLLERELADRGECQISLSLAGGQVSARERILHDPDAGRTWTRLSVRREVPDGLERSDKLTPRETTLAIAHGDQSAPGRLFAGLPLAIGGALPFSANAQFDTDASRTTMVQERWNEWILSELADLSAAAALHRLSERPADSWTAIPLSSEVSDVADPWLRERLTSVVHDIQNRVRDDGRLPGRDGLAPLRAFTAEAVELEGLLDDADLTDLSVDKEPLVSALRDGAGRWRVITDELEVTDRLSVAEALGMLAWPEEKLGTRDPAFFLRVAAIALSAGLSSQLETAPFIALADGGRVSPQSAKREGLLLVTASEGDSLGHTLGVVKPLAEEFGAETEDAAAVREYLARSAGLKSRPASEDAIRALAGRAMEEPVYLADNVLIALREGLRRLSDQELESLGRRIGERILVDGREYERGRSHPVRVRPAHAYLPAAIDTGALTWAKAAHHTPGVAWIHPRYARDLRPGRRRRSRAVLDLQAERAARTAAQRQRRGARSLFTDLGAETAPRLQPCRPDISRHGQWAKSASFAQLAGIQQEALAGEDGEVGGLADDYESPTLQAVCEDIARAKIVDARPRAEALLGSLNRAWGRLYAAHLHAEAVNTYFSLSRLRRVPATWRARAAEVRWMTNEVRGRRAPRELGIRTPGFLAMFGEAPRFYAHGLDATDAATPAVQAFGFESLPRATTLVTRLEELRAADTQGKPSESAAVARVYAALAAAAPPASAKGVRRHVDNLPVKELERRFRKADGMARGLVRTEDRSWMAPSEVFVGRAIFGEYADFVSDDAERLWVLLGMHRPEIEDCVAVLGRVALEASGPECQGLLWEVYRELASLLDAAPDANLAALRRLPVWIATEWSTNRPVYAVADAQLQQRLSEHLPVWQPPGPLEPLQPLIEPLGLSVLPEDTYVPLGISTGALAAGSALRARFQSAMRHLRDWLTLEDPELHDRISSVDWERLLAARIAVNKRLHVEIPVPGRTSIQVQTSAHVQRSTTVLFAFSDRGVMESSDVMGSRLAHIFCAEDRERVVLEYGWLKALASVDVGAALKGIRLSSPASDSASDDAEIVDSALPSAVGTVSVPSILDGSVPPSVSSPPGPGGPAPRLVTRRLKRLGDIAAELEWVAARIEVGAPQSTDVVVSGPTVELRPPKTTEGSSAAAAPHLGPASWTPEDRETLGFRLLARELKRTRGLTLSDVRKQKLVGADAIDQNGVYYELKVGIGALDDTVSLTPSEFERAKAEGKNFVLVVISGIETGYETRMKLIPDPLQILKWIPEVDIQISGIRDA